MYSNNKSKLFLSVLLLLLFSTGCALVKNQQISQDEMLATRVNQAWQSKLDDTLSNVYDMTIAAFKAEVSKEKFLRGSNVPVSEYTIEKIELADSKKQAFVTVTYTITPFGQEFTLTTKEEWLYEEEEWRLNLLPALRSPIPGLSTGKKK